MIRAVVVADSGAVLSSITSSLCRLEHVDIVAYASGRSSLIDVARVVAPDVILVDEMRRPGQALERIDEARAAEPLAVIVGVADHADGLWAKTALDAGASAVVPRDIEPDALDLVLREVVDARRVHDLVHAQASTTNERSAA
jgi:DNA-binding NarL/FixJ family response regulator